MLDFKITKSQKALHPVYLKIVQQYNALSRMLSFMGGAVSSAQEDVKTEYDARIQQIPTEELQEEQRLHYEKEYLEEDLFNIEHYFCQSAFLMVYSYFDSMMQLMMLVHTKQNRNWSKTKRGKFSSNPLSTNFSIKLDDKRKEDFDYLYTTIRVLRNMTVHNYNGAPAKGQIITAKKESDRKIGFTFVESKYPNEKEGFNYHYFYTKKYVEMVLETEFRVLSAIAEKLNMM